KGLFNAAVGKRFFLTLARKVNIIPEFVVRVMRYRVSDRVKYVASHLPPLTFEVVNKILLREVFRVRRQPTLLAISVDSFNKQCTAQVPLHRFIKSDLPQRRSSICIS